MQRRRLPLAARERWSRADPDRAAPRSSRGAFAAAVERVAEAVDAVDRTLDEGESVTQFEAATAAAFVALAAAGVEVGGDRGRARRPPRRDQRAALAGHGADLDRARAHRVAGRDRARDRGREARRAARPHDAGRSARSRPRSRSSRAATATERHAQLVDRARPRAGGRARRARRPTCAATSPSPWPRPRRCSARSTPSGSRRSPPGSSCPGGWRWSTGDPPLVLDAAHNPAGARGAGRGAARGGRRAAGGRLPRGARRQGRGGDRRGAGAGARRAWWRPRSPRSGWRRPGGRGRGRWRRATWPRWRARPGLGWVEEEADPAAAVARARARARELGGVGARHRLALPAALRDRVATLASLPHTAPPERPPVRASATACGTPSRRA